MAKEIMKPPTLNIFHFHGGWRTNISQRTGEMLQINRHLEAAMSTERKRRSFSLEILREHAQSMGGRCLSESYQNSTFKMLFICKNGHKWRSTPLEIMGKKNKVGTWCPKCALGGISSDKQ